jgi:ribosomal protein S12 methylthiotransferase accessory factor
MAVLEACQGVIGNIAGGREDLSLQARSLGRHERPKPARSTADAFWNGRNHNRVPLASIEGAVFEDLYEEFKWVRRRLAEAGLRQLIALDLTRPGIQPIRVTRVIVPGLETINPFHCGHRARTVLSSDVLLH